MIALGITGGIVLAATMVATIVVMILGLRRAYETQIKNLTERLQDALVAAQTEREWVRSLEEAKLQAELEVEAQKRANNERDLRYQREKELTVARVDELSRKILAETSEKLKRDSGENIGLLLKPLQEELNKFRQRIDEVNTEDATRAGKLDERIRRLVEDTNQVSAKANELAAAIRGEAQVTGEWAEMQLKSILDMAGLREGTDYSYQESFAAEGSGHKDKRMDFLIKLPEERWMVVDSKATVAAYADFIGTTDETDRKAAQERIVASVKAHIDEMARANYAKELAIAQGKNLLPTMLMYIPFDEVYLMAMKARIKVQANGRDETITLREYAAKRNIAMVNGASAVPLVRLIETLWINYNVDKKAVRIKETAEGLVDKFNTFVNGFQDLGKAIGKVNEQYNTSIRQLSAGPGNVLKRLKDLQELGVPEAAKVLEPEELEAKIIHGNA